MSGTNHLEVTAEDPKLKLLERFFGGDNNEVGNIFNTPILKPTKQITPTPGFCIKSKEVSGEKIFLNLCFSDDIPEPPPISEEDLIKDYESGDSSFRIPMSIGSVHRELDKNETSCQTYDVVVNSVWFKNVVSKSSFMFTFLVTASLEAIQEKNNLDIVQEGWVKLRNRKYFGTMPTHFIQDRKASSSFSPQEPELKIPNRTPAQKPMIEDITDSKPKTQKGSKAVQEKVNKNVKLKADSETNTQISNKSVLTLKPTYAASDMSEIESEINIFPNASNEGSKPKIIEIGQKPANICDTSKKEFKNSSKTFYEEDSPHVIIYSKETSNIEPPSLGLNSKNKTTKALSSVQPSDFEENHDCDKDKRVPHFKLYKFPAKGYPQSLRYLISLPKLKTSTNLFVNISVDSLQITHKLYDLDLNLPYLVIKDEASAFFNKITQILSVTLPIIPSSKR